MNERSISLAEQACIFGRLKLGLILLVVWTGIVCHVREYKERNEHFAVRSGGAVAMCCQRYVK